MSARDKHVLPLSRLGDSAFLAELAVTRHSGFGWQTLRCMKCRVHIVRVPDVDRALETAAREAAAIHAMQHSRALQARIEREGLPT